MADAQPLLVSERTRPSATEHPRPHAAARARPLRRAVAASALAVIAAASAWTPVGSRAVAGTVAAGLVGEAAVPSPSALGATAALTSAQRLYLPRLERDAGSWPDAALAERVWDALAAFERRHRLEALLPAADVTPTVGAALANVDAACRDFPDIPDVFGPGAHRDACRVWVPDAFGLFYAARALRLVDAGRPLDDPAVARAHGWAVAYLAVATGAMETFVFVRCEPPNPFGPNEPPRHCLGHRDTRAAIWQNTQRALELGLLADVAGRSGPIDADLSTRLADVLVSAARAWRSAFWATGRMPNADVVFTTLTAAVAPASSLRGEPVAATRPITIVWNADKHNTPAEEMAWMGAGVVVAMAVAGDRISATERAALVAAGRHYVDYALTDDRPDPLFGVAVRTVGRETTGGPYGQNRGWLENHQDDAPSVPYLGFTWGSLGLALATSDAPDGRPWPSFAPPDVWPALARTAEATLIAPDGRSLVDLAPEGGLGFDVARFPLWTMPCGVHRAGALYVDVGADRPAGVPRFVSEIGHPAGLSVVLAGVPLIGAATAAGDLTTARRWQRRVDAALAELARRPPGFEGVACKVAPWVSTEPAYHWAYIVNSYLHPWLMARGHRIGAAGVPTAAP